MKQLTVYELYAYKQALQNTWRNYIHGKDSLSCNKYVFLHLQKRYLNIKKIIKRREAEISNIPTTYHVVKTVGVVQ